MNKNDIMAQTKMKYKSFKIKERRISFFKSKLIKKDG